VADPTDQGAVPLDPIDPTVIGPGLAAIPLAPTVWDDLPDGQWAVTPDGRVFRRRNGLWHLDPWWQGTDGAEIIAVCEYPNQWAYDSGWPRKMVEDAHGVLTPITLPSTYPHDDDRCRQDSVAAEGFISVCRALAAAGVPDTMSAAEGVDWLAARVAAERASERERLVLAIVDHADLMETYTLPALQPGFIDGWQHALRLLRRDAYFIASRAAIKEATDE